MSTDKEVTIQDILKARLQAAIDCVNLNDLKGCKYSLQIALKIIEQNEPKPSEPPIVTPSWVDEWNRSGSNKYPL
jgi:hypothetical protein